MRFIPIIPFAVASLLGCAWLAACSAVPASVLPSRTPRISIAFEVSEIRRLLQCAAASDNAAVTLIADAAALRDWQQARGVDLIGNAPLPAGPFAVVDHGSRATGGYGIAVSRPAVQRGAVLSITASFLSPKSDETRGYALTSPCVLVKLPVGNYDRVEIVDPSGKRRAVSALPTPAPP